MAVKSRTGVSNSGTSPGKRSAAARTASIIAAGSLAVAILAPARSAHAQEPERPVDTRGTFTIVIENDALAQTDRHYTSGLRLSWVSSEDLPRWLQGIAGAFPLFPDSARHRYGFSLGQSIFTPDNTETAQPVLDDRPYAAWLYGGLILLAESRGRLDTFELDLGVVGPSAQGEWVQNNVHDIIGTGHAMGWDNQLRDEPGIVLYYERRWRGLVEFHPRTLGFDLDPHLGAAIGNVFTYAAAGLMLRFGWDLPADYGPPRVRPALAGSAFFVPENGFGWYFFVGTEGRAVARNIFLDGNTFRDSQSVDKEPLVADLQAGVAVTIGAVRLAYTYVYRTREFEGQDEPDRFAAISLSFRF